MADEPPPRRTRRRIAVALPCLLAVALLLAWFERVPIANRFVERTLAARGVPARYRIADLGFGRQRLENVVIGDPANPDLVADWVETRTDLGLSGPRLAGVSAGRVRVRGRLVGGRVTLGAVDRLLPAPSGKPFALPAIDLAVADARMRIETPYGLVGLKLAGRGGLDDGFTGTIAAVGDRLAGAGCAAQAPSAFLSVSIRSGAPTLRGPIRADRLACGKTIATAPVMTIDATLRPALDAWNGQARLRVATVATPAGRLADVAGTIGFAGDARATTGPVALAAARFATPRANGGAVTADGRWRSSAPAGFEGDIRARKVTLASGLRARVTGLSDAADGSPVAPLVRAATAATDRAARRFDASAHVVLGIPFAAKLTGLTIESASGARLRQTGTIVADRAGVAFDGRVELAGGGLPTVRADLVRTGSGETRGTIAVAPYTAGGAALALTPVRLRAAGSMIRIATTATLSGPLGDGRVDGLAIPIGAVARRGTLTVNPACTPLAFRTLAVAGLRLRPARLTLCPTGTALVRVAGGRVDGGARMVATTLRGTLGSSPVSLALSGARASLADRGFAIEGLRTRLGPPDRATRLDIARLDGRIGCGGIAGRFEGGAGQIGKVPLLLSAVAGDWRLLGGVLRVDGALGVADAAADPRFAPLAARGVMLTLAGDSIDAAGTLFAPVSGAKVADVAIRHALSRGAGEARIAVPALVFGDSLQPDALTRLTLGVIADVKGTVTGDARIAWTPQTVTSTGTFRTAKTDLAAAFGPVRGLSTEIRFTDLLSLESAPAQVATVRSINPGIPVQDGRVVFRTMPGNRVDVTGARWPFAGGTLTLEPTLLDFSAERTRRLTFRVDGMDAGKFLQQFDFDNLTATGTFDGTLPMLFDATGGRIEGGGLVVRPGGGTIAYAGDLSQKNLGFWGNLAFRSLRSLRYRRLNLMMSGPLAGEMVTEVKFAGVSQGEGAKSNFLIRRLQKLPLVFNVTIRAPFRGLIDSVASFYDPNRLIARNLPALIEEQKRLEEKNRGTVQPPASAATISPAKD